MYLITWIITHLPTLRDEWLSWACWLTDSGRLNRKLVTHLASSLSQDRESSPAETSVLTTTLRRQPMSLLAVSLEGGGLTRCLSPGARYPCYATEHREYNMAWGDFNWPRPVHTPEYELA